jgi:di/tricarboxylate transporter
VTPDIGLVLAILVVSLVLFISERIRMDVVALMVLVALAVTGLVSPNEAVAGFANPAVITVWAMFMLSAGLTLTGVAGVIGRKMMVLVGASEPRIIIVVMVTSAVLSAFMNNIGVAALLLPVTMDIAKHTGKPPSRLLMPLAFGSLLGGLTTLIGTPPNLLIAEALERFGHEPFGMFDFTPIGGVVALAGILFIALWGRKLLPVTDTTSLSRVEEPAELERVYALRERTMMMRIPAGSRLEGRSLRQSRIGSATGLNVVVVERDGETLPAPSPSFRLQAGDRLLVEGRLDRFEELRGWRELIPEAQDVGLEQLVSSEIGLAEIGAGDDSSLAGTTLVEIDFRKRYGGIVLAVRRDEQVIQSDLAQLTLRRGDRMLVLGRREDIDRLRHSQDFETFEDVARTDLVWRYGLEERVFVVRVPTDSVLCSKSLDKARLGDALGFGVLGIRRRDGTRLLPEPDERLLGDDRLIVRGDLDDLEVFHGLQELEIEDEPAPDLRTLETEQAALVEAILSPHTSLARKTLSELQFRERYGVQVLAIVSQGETIRSNLAQRRLRFGDALLLFGRRDDLERLGSDPDFVLLTEKAQPALKTRLAPVAGVVMAAVVTTVLLGWLPISIAAVAGAVLMILSGCLTMEDAYRAIEWRSIFLIAGMLPLGTAMEDTGAAAYLADAVLTVVGPLGPWGVLVGLYLVTAAATMIIPTAALVVLMAPIVMRASAETGVSVQSLMMGVAIAASASFTSPISHPANLLVMGPGGYRFVDYVKLGTVLTLVVMVVALLLLPWFWPF